MFDPSQPAAPDYGNPLLAAAAPMTTPAPIQHVAICVATRGRPGGLARLLGGLCGQDISPRRDLYLRIVIASNGEGHQIATRQIVDAFAAKSPFPIHFQHDDRPGIARARNRACLRALEFGADWIAFIDDDETPAADWIARLMAPEYLHIPVLIGRRDWIYPTNPPFWTPQRRPRVIVEGGPAKRFTTANVRFSAELLRSGLRFDESMGLAGGSDQRFFQDARRRGFAIHDTSRAVTWEYAHATRLTYRFQIARHFAHLASLTHTKIRERGRAAVLRETIGRQLKNVPLGVIELAFAPLAAAAGRERFKRFAMRGGRRLAEVAGVVAAFRGHLPQVYQIVHGE